MLGACCAGETPAGWPGEEDSLSRNFSRPSKVWASPAIMVPTAETRLCTTPRMVCRMPWMTARMEPRIDVKTPTMDEMREETLDAREGMLALASGLSAWASFGLGLEPMLWGEAAC